MEGFLGSNLKTKPKMVIDLGAELNDKSSGNMKVSSGMDLDLGDEFGADGFDFGELFNGITLCFPAMNTRDLIPMPEDKCLTVSQFVILQKKGLSPSYYRHALSRRISLARVCAAGL
jgi:hypothetical protein